MGYYTRFNLSWSVTDSWKPPSCGHQNGPNAKFCQECGASLEAKVIDKMVGDYIVMNLAGAITRTGHSCDESRWYEHESDMRIMSVKIPNVLFHLTGEGEEHDDVWDLFALNGQVQKHKAKIVRAERPDQGAWK